MPKILSSIACNLDNDILAAALPLFEAEKVQAIEWSFDTLSHHRNIPEWFTELLMAFSDENRLIGHGVFFSLFSGKWLKEQDFWLAHLRKIANNFTFDHITEHFGFMTGDDFHKGAPLSIPFTNSTLALGHDRLKRIQDACQCPVGLENLAFSYSLDEVKKHGDFLNKLVEPINGFIILDLHNLYCQMHNFDMPFSDIIGLYPLEKVREIHISGGSWEPVLSRPDKQVRRDTHDDGVPKEVFDLLKKTIPQCPNLKFVVLEQLGNGLNTEGSRGQFQEDFYTLDHIVDTHNQVQKQAKWNDFLPKTPVSLDDSPFEDASLYAQQLQLSHILETATNYTHAQSLLAMSDLAQTDWQTELWQPYMLETALAIAQKWKNGF
jgi:uncharacterized protein